MKKSLRKQLSIMFISTLVFVIATSVVANTLLLVRYYEYKKKTSLINAYKLIGSLNLNDSNEQEKSDVNILKKIAEKDNLLILILDKNGSNVYSSTSNSRELKDHLVDYALPDIMSPSEIDANNFGKIVIFDYYDKEINTNNEVTVIKKEKNYEINKVKDLDLDSEYLEIWGTLNNEYKFIMRTPITSIKESVELTNQFLLYILLTSVLIGVIIAWILAKKITEPIKSFADISEKMANLDFGAKYEGLEENEIGVLGKNFNKMSFKLEETINELKKANDKLKEDIKLQEKINEKQSEFISNVSHELKTPIALIQGYAEGLESNISENPQTKKYYIDVILDETNKMNRFVKDLLTLETYEEEQNLEKTEFDLVELVKGVIKREKTINEDYEFVYEGVHSIKVYSDPYRIEQVIINYINNALNHSIDKKIVVKCKDMYNNKIYLGVYNKGKSISHDDMSRIWDKFYKADKAHTREYGGSGIGLSIVKAIMKNLGGSYAAKNINEGVEFYIEI